MGRQITLEEMIKECEYEQKVNTETIKLPEEPKGRGDEKKVLSEELGCNEILQQARFDNLRGSSK